MGDVQDFGILLRAGAPLVVLETHDETRRALDLLQRVARELEKTLYRWSLTDGLEVAGLGLRLQTEAEYRNPEDLLQHLKTSGKPGIYMLCDFHPWLKDQPVIVRLLKDIALRNEQGAITLVLTSHALALPAELARFAAAFELALPGRGQILDLVRDEARKWAGRNRGFRVRSDTRILEQLTANL